MVDQCHETASYSLAHKYYVGKGKARVGLRNDVFVCSLHIGTIAKYRLFANLAEIYLFLWMGFGFLAMIVTGLAGSFRWRKAWPYFLLVIPGVVLFIMADRFSLKKKAQYHMPGVGEFGSVWKDDNFSAPFL